MKFKYYIDRDQEIVVRSFHGDISLDSLEKSLALVWADPDYDPRYSGIADFRDSKILFSKLLLFKIIKTVSENVLSLQGKVAILVSEPISAATATIYTEQLKNVSKLEIFCYLLEATEYLQTDENILKCLESSKAINVE